MRRAKRYFVYSAKAGRLREPRGPYTARAARSYARIAAASGKHNRVVTRGRRGRVVRIYQRGTGAHLFVGDVGFDPSPFLFLLTALHAERRVPPGYTRSKHGKGMHGEEATLYLYPNKDVYVLPDSLELSGYRVPGGSKDLDVSGTGAYWVIVHLSHDGRSWKRVFNGPAGGDEAGSFLSLAPVPTPFVRETWYKKTSSGWKKQGSKDNWS